MTSWIAIALIVVWVIAMRVLHWRASWSGGTDGEIFERDVSDGKIDRVQDLKCVL